MVARMMRWRPWPPILSKKFRVRLVVRRIEGLGSSEAVAAESAASVTTGVRWKGPRAGMSPLRRTVRMNCTREEEVRGGGVVEWNEEFESVCCLTGYRENSFQPWEIAFETVLNGLNNGHKNNSSLIGTASLNLAEFTSTAEEEIEINLPLLPLGVTAESHPSLHVALSLLELRTFQDSSETLQRSIVPALMSPSSDVLPPELSGFKAGIRKVKILAEFMSTLKAKKSSRDDEGSEGRCSARSDNADNAYPFDTDSLDDDSCGDPEDGKDDPSIRKSFSYDTLASANFVGGSLYSNVEYEYWVYYNHGSRSCMEELASSVPEQPTMQNPKKSILPWKKRKYNLRSPKAKGEPLLKKAYGEEGGDDIDYDRRQLSSSDESLFIGWHKVDDDGSSHCSSVSDFGDDNFEVGRWESKELVSRDGHMKLSTQVFFASIDQRSERASGESACTALVAVIADWLQSNRGTMPIKSQFDSLIREGSLEWRNLCKDHTYRDRFPDKHFDLETVLQAKIRPLSVKPQKSFIGFFHPEVANDNSDFDFLHGAMSFDSIWDEISRSGSDFPADGSPQLYIVSWNDHFFVLKVEHDAYYIIDTLGERLFEGCSQAYVLKFDESTSIHKIRDADKSEAQQKKKTNAAAEEEFVCRGKESCKEYIKSFLAAIPIRELQDDITRGLMASTPLHHRLQIEFHFTETFKEVGDVASLLAAAEEVVEFPLPAAEFTLTPAVEVV